MGDDGADPAPDPEFVRLFGDVFAATGGPPTDEERAAVRQGLGLADDQEL